MVVGDAAGREWKMISGPSTATAASHKGYTQVRLHTHTNYTIHINTPDNLSSSRTVQMYCCIG